MKNIDFINKSEQFGNLTFLSFFCIVVPKNIEEIIWDILFKGTLVSESNRELLEYLLE